MFKKLKTLFIIEEGVPVKDGKAPEEPKETTTKQASSTARSFEVTPGDASVGKVQDKFLDVLFQALESSNQDGFDYMEFKNFLKSLSNVQMDDHTRYKSAFATAQTMGATKDNILKSAKNYIDILSKEQTKFQEALQAKKDQNLTGKQQEIKQLESSIKTKTADIERMKSEIEASQKQIGSLEKDINSASEKLAQTANDFEASYQALLLQIQNDIQSIESHL